MLKTYSCVDIGIFVNSVIYILKELSSTIIDHIAFSFAAIKGLNSDQPSHSCKDIRDSGDSRGDGEYWIDPEKSGNSLKVFCDMTTDGGNCGGSIKLVNQKSMYGLLTKCEVKMAGYWPSSFFPCFINSQKKNEANTQPS